MATEVLTGFNDFVLFPQQRNDIYPSFQLPFADGSVDQPYQDMGSNFPQGFTSFGNYYEPYHQEHVHHNAPRSQADEHAYSKNVASASPSISLSQFLDQAPSNFSHTSVASGQSTASSAVGSPYSQHQSLPAGQDQWNEMGLGIAGTLAPTDMFPGTYQLTSTEAERVFDDKFASTFVGESPQVFQHVSSASSTMSSVSCSSFSEASSAEFPLTAVSPDWGSIPTFDDYSFDRSPAACRGSRAANEVGGAGTPAFQPSRFPGSQQHRVSQIHNTFFAQSSGNFVAPLESSCWFSFAPRIPGRVHALD